MKDDVRESLYDLCNEWTKSLSTNSFQGCSSPNLSDLVNLSFFQQFKHLFTVFLRENVRLCMVPFVHLKVAQLLKT